MCIRDRSEKIPLKVRIVTMESGYPSQKIMKNSEVEVDPINVNISDDGTLPTHFGFKAPVYLPKGDYAFYLGSSSGDYDAWISQVGEADIIVRGRYNYEAYDYVYRSGNAWNLAVGDVPQLETGADKTVGSSNQTVTEDAKGSTTVKVDDGTAFSVGDLISFSSADASSDATAFTFNANDGNSTGNTSTVTITVNSVNDAPSIDIDSNLSAAENQTAVATISSALKLASL